MKKISTLFSLLMLTGVMALAQSPRMIMLEHFTQASCGYCPAGNNHLDQLLDANPDKITCVKYQVNWPGYDPMNLDNPEDVNSRKSVYNPSGVPHSQLDGNYFGGAYTGITQTSINTRAAMPSPFELDIIADIDKANDVIKATVRINVTQATTGPKTLYIVAIEKLIHFNTPPGSNGEKDFRNVMKKLIPGKNGITLPQTMEAGTYYIYDMEWNYTDFNIYDEDQLAIVGFIQNPSSKEMFQAANGSEDNFPALFGYDAQVSAVKNIDGVTCRTNATPVVTIRNNGAQPLTSLSLQYSFNGEAQQTYEWTGNLAYLETADVTLPMLGYTLQTSNNFTISCSNPSGNNDEYAANNTTIFDFEASPVTTHNILINIKTDNNPQENTYDVQDMEGNIIASGGPFEEAGKVYSITIPVENEGCYMINLYDSGNNGICCTNGFGVFQASDDVGTVIAQGSKFGDKISGYFHVGPLTGLTTLPIMDSDWTLYPNPANEYTEIAYNATTAGNLSVIMYDMMGKVMNSTHYASRTGKQIYRINTLSMPAGIYFVVLESNGTRSVKKMALNK